MISGSYPCCDGDLTLSVEGIDTPVIQREICPHCGALVWHKLSRLDPESWTDVEFRKFYDVNDETKVAKPKGYEPIGDVNPAVQALMTAAMDRAAQAMADGINNDLMTGDQRRAGRGRI